MSNSCNAASNSPEDGQSSDSLQNVCPSWLTDSMADTTKLRVADYARLMGDNQMNLNIVAETDRRNREREHQVSDALASQQIGRPIVTDSPAPTVEPMDIRVDSPQTNNYYQPPATAASDKAIPAWAKTAAIVAGLLGAGGTGAGVSAWLSDDQSSPAVDRDTRYELRLADDVDSLDS